MPSALIKSFSKKTGKTDNEVETLYNKAKEQAKEQGKEKNYAYIAGILKNMLGLKKANFSVSEVVSYFLESNEPDYYNFYLKFFEELGGGATISTQFETRPEKKTKTVILGNKKGKDVLEDEDEEESDDEETEE